MELEVTVGDVTVVWRGVVPAVRAAVVVCMQQVELSTLGTHDVQPDTDATPFSFYQNNEKSFRLFGMSPVFFCESLLGIAVFGCFILIVFEHLYNLATLRGFLFLNSSSRYGSRLVYSSK